MRLFISSILLSIGLLGSELDEFAKNMGFERDYKIAINKAKKSNKPLLLVIGKDDCGWCRRYESRTLSDKLVQTKLHQNFIVVIVDKKHDKQRYPAKKYETNFTPYSIFIEPNRQELILQKYGYIKKDDFINILNTIIKR